MELMRFLWCAAAVAAFGPFPTPRPHASPVAPARPARLGAGAPPARSCVRRRSSETGEADAETVAEDVGAGEPAEEIAEDDPNAEVKAAIAAANEKLKEKRLALSRANGALQEASQAGYMRVVAEVSTYKTQAAERQKGIAEVAKADAFKAFDAVLLAFEAAVADLPASGDAEAKVHGDFQLVYDGLLEQFRLLGMEDFAPAPGDDYEPLAHDAAVTRDGDGDVATVAEIRKPGFKLKSGAVIRKATVVVDAAKVVEAAPEEAADEAADDAAAAE